MIPSFPVNSLGTTNPEILDRILKILSIHSPPSLPPSLPPPGEKALPIHFIDGSMTSQLPQRRSFISTGQIRLLLL